MHWKMDVIFIKRNLFYKPLSLDISIVFDFFIKMDLFGLKMLVPLLYLMDIFMFSNIYMKMDVLGMKIAVLLLQNMDILIVSVIYI